MSLAVVQHASSNSALSANTVAITVPATGAGRLLTVIVGFEPAAGSVAGVSDGTNAFAKVSGSDASITGVFNAEVWRLYVSTAGKTTITATFTGAAGTYQKLIHYTESSGFILPTVDVIGVVSNGTGAGTTMSGPSLTTTAPAGVGMAVCMCFGGVTQDPKTGNAWTAGGEVDTLAQASCSVITAAAGATQPQWVGGATNDTYLSVAVVFRESSFTKTLTGGVTSAGMPAKSARVAKAGSVTSAGTPSKLDTAPKTGAVAASATATKQAQGAKSGAIPSAGANTKAAAAAKSGTTAPSGAPSKQAGKPTSGTLTSAGVIALLRVVLRSLAGAIGASGAITRAAAKASAGTITDAGAIAKLPKKSTAGAITSSGVITKVKVILLALAGALGMSGVASKSAARALSGAISLAGAVAKLCRRTIAGSAGSVGATTRATTKAAAGTVSGSGALARQTSKAAAGAIAMAGGIGRLITKILNGALSWAGAITQSGGGVPVEPHPQHSPTFFTPLARATSFTPLERNTDFAPVRTDTYFVALSD